MAPILDIADGDFERAKKLLKYGGVNFSIPKERDSGSIYVPSLDLFVEKGTTPAMGTLSLYQFAKFLLHIRDNEPEIYKEITSSRYEPRIEYTDTFFRKRKDGIWVFTNRGMHEEKLDKNTLVEEKRISLDSWLKNPTSQGLPREDIEEGELYYWPPRDGTAAAFASFSNGMNLACRWKYRMGSFYTRVRTAENSEQLTLNL